LVGGLEEGGRHLLELYLLLQLYLRVLDGLVEIGLLLELGLLHVLHLVAVHLLLLVLLVLAAVVGHVRLVDDRVYARELPLLLLERLGSLLHVEGCMLLVALNRPTSLVSILLLYYLGRMVCTAKVR